MGLPLVDAIDLVEDEDRRLLGGHRDRVPAYASGSLRRGLTHDQAQRAAETLVRKGFREMKTQMALPGNPPPAEEVRRVRVVREAIGPDIKLMCDINQRWRPEQAIDIGSRVEDESGQVLGTVEGVQANPASDLLVLSGGALIPLRFVGRTEPAARVVVALPDGLLDLY